MADQPTKIREVAWSELFPWLILIRSIRIAMMARVLLLGTAGIIATLLGWWLLTWMFSGVDDPAIPRAADATTPWLWEESGTFRVATSARSADEVFASASNEFQKAPIEIFLFFTRPFIDLFRGDLTASGFFFLLLCCVWLLVVWGIVGGAITRIAALKFTRDEAPGITTAVVHGARKLPSYSLPPLIALAGASVFAIQLVILGMVMRADVLALVAAIIWPFVIMLGLLMAILLLGALIGWPLMWATVSVEGTDAFDALSRSYAYVYHRPLRLLWYVLFAGLLAIVSMFVVKLFAASAIALGDWSIDWGLDDRTMAAVVSDDASPQTGPELVPALPTEDPLGLEDFDETSPATDEEPELNTWLAGARRTIYFWKSLVATLAAGYQAGFLWVSAVGIYLLMRRDIDGVLLNEVYVDQSEDYGLPPLADEAATGVPDVSTTQPAVPGSI